MKSQLQSLFQHFQDKIEFMTKHHKENDSKNKKQISELKTDNKNKERDLKKFENDLKRATDKVALLEEKVVAIKADFKTKEEDKLKLEVCSVDNSHSLHCNCLLKAFCLQGLRA